jgi:hypothetical protein
MEKTVSPFSLRRTETVSLSGSIGPPWAGSRERAWIWAAGKRLEKHTPAGDEDDLKKSEKICIVGSGARGTVLSLRMSCKQKGYTGAGTDVLVWGLLLKRVKDLPNSF